MREVRYCEVAHFHFVSFPPLFPLHDNNLAGTRVQSVSGEAS